jgi:hypothetical protein
MVDEVSSPPGWWADRERARAIGGRLNVANAELVDLVAKVIVDRTWSGDGIRSVEHWLMLNAGLSPAHAREVVRVSERRPDLPTVLGGEDDGEPDPSGAGPVRVRRRPDQAGVSGCVGSGGESARGADVQ